MNSSVVKITENYYVDEREVSSVGRWKDEKRDWTIINVKGAETYVAVPFDEVLRLINWIQ